MFKESWLYMSGEYDEKSEIICDDGCIIKIYVPVKGENDLKEKISSVAAEFILKYRETSAKYSD